MKEMENPWTILSEKKMYGNNWIEVTEYQVLNPSGGPGIYGKVHFKSSAVGILPLDADFNTYLVGQYRFPLNQYSWEIPEGGGDPDQDPLLAAQRELMEETGLHAREWVPLVTMHLSNSVSDEWAIVYLATGLEQGTAMPEETEQLQVKKIPFEEAYQMLERGEITDSMSVAAIQKLRIMQLEGRIGKPSTNRDSVNPKH